MTKSPYTRIPELEQEIAQMKKDFCLIHAIIQLNSTQVETITCAGRGAIRSIIAKYRTEQAH